MMKLPSILVKTDQKQIRNLITYSWNMHLKHFSINVFSVVYEITMRIFFLILSSSSKALSLVQFNSKIPLAKLYCN